MSFWNDFHTKISSTLIQSEMNIKPVQTTETKNKYSSSYSSLRLSRWPTFQALQPHFHFGRMCINKIIFLDPCYWHIGAYKLHEQGLVVIFNVLVLDRTDPG